MQELKLKAVMLVFEADSEVMISRCYSVDPPCFRTNYACQVVWAVLVV